MITNFENITFKLKSSEVDKIPKVVKLLKGIKKKSPIKEQELLELINGRINDFNISGVKLRQIINYIRTNSLLSIIGTSKGYYSSSDVVEIEKQILSLQNRIDRLESAKKGMKEILNNVINK